MPSTAHGRHPVARRPCSARSVCGLRAGQRRAHRVEVVLAAEQHRQPPQRREVQRLVELALGDRALAEEARGDARRGRAGGRPAPARRRAAGRRRRWRCRRRSAGAASKRCIEPPRPRLQPSTLPNISAMTAAAGTPAGQRVAVLAVGGDDRVLRVERLHHARRRRPPRRCRGAGSRGSSRRCRARRSAPRTGGCAASRRSSVAARARRSTSAVGWRSVIAHLQRRQVALGQPELAGLEQPAHDLAAARVRQVRGRRRSPSARPPRRAARRAKPSSSQAQRPRSARSPGRSVTNALTTSPATGSGTPITPASTTAGCSISALSTSNGPMRCPADLITSSARPTNQNQPSASRRARSPVRYQPPAKHAR